MTNFTALRRMIAFRLSVSLQSIPMPVSGLAVIARKREARRVLAP